MLWPGNQGNLFRAVRVSLGRDPESGTWKYHNKTIRGSFREAQSYLSGKLQEREIGRLPRAAAMSLNQCLDQWLTTAAKPRMRPKSYSDYEALLRLHIRPHLGTRPLGAIPEIEWLANITNPKTRRAYRMDVREFSAFAGQRSPAELRGVTRAHVIAWRKALEGRALSPATIRRKLSALSSLYDYLCERNAVLGNPVDGVKRPSANGNEGSTLPLVTRKRAACSMLLRTIR